jgi:hypothetical protein
MANILDNITRKISEEIMEGVESKRTISKNVNTQMLTGKFGPETGSTTEFRRPIDYRAVRTSDGDLTSETDSDIVTAHATGYVQDYITVSVSISEAVQAIEAGNLREKLSGASTRIVTTLETDFAAFAMRNSALLYGTPGTPAATWDDVAGAGATLQGTGVPSDDQWNYIINPYTQRKLASDTRSLGAGGVMGGTISEAHKRAILTDNFAGMRVMTATTLATYQTGVGAGRTGALAATPDGTYATNRNTMTQTLSLSGFQANLVIAAGETIQVAGRNRLNLSTRLPVIDDTGSQVLWTATVTATVTLDGAGAGTIIATGPGINEVDGQYNTVDSVLTSGDVVTLFGAASTIYQPNLFFNKNAFSIGSVPLERLHATDTFAETEDGLQMRVTQYSDGRANTNKVRIDLRPAYAALNPFFAGLGFGV